MAGVLVTIAPEAWAQTGTLRGTVADATTGEPLSGVRVEAAAPGTARAAFTDTRGRYELTGLATASYLVTATRIGYAPQRVAGVAVAAGGTSLYLTLTAMGVPLDAVVVSATRTEQTVLAAPASVSVLDRATIEEQTALTPLEHVRTTPGMDMADKGLIQHTYTARGSRGSNDGSLLTLTDYRNAEVPSLTFNVSYLIPATDEDIERIEVMRGPGAALYGPGADRGVVHVFTRSPFESRGLSLSVAGGGRELFQGTVRWAAVLSRTVAVKLAADYVRGRDWPFRDSAEQALRDTAVARGARADTLLIGRREPDLERAGGEARLDWRPGVHTDVTVSTGMSQAVRIVELAGDVGSSQVRDWRYTTAQLRLRHHALFANAFYNLSNTGDTYLLRTGTTVVDSSRVAVAQVQYSSRLGRVDLLYGADLRWTDPRTGGTIDGENEDRDRVTEVGGYVHGTAALTPRLMLVGALRADRHSVLDDAVLSPRLGLVFRPRPSHALRLTYNRAFTSPDANTLFLDIVAGRLPGGLPYDVRAGSVPSGYTFRRDCGGPCMRSPFNADPAQFLPPDATLLWPAIVQILQAQGVDISGIPAPTGAQVGSAFATLNIETGAVNPVTAADIADIPAYRRTITTTLELGWKAALRRRAEIGVDLYTSRVSDNTGARFTATPNVFLDPLSLFAYLQNYLPANQALPLAGTIASIPVGTISPRETTHPTDILVLSRQGGAYRLWGMDLSLNVTLSPSLLASGAWSWVSDDSLANVGAAGTVVLSAPRNKGSLGMSWRDERRGLAAGAQARAVQSFPVASGVYVGRVRGYTVLDASVGLRLPGARNVRLTVDARNLMNNRHREFVGSPAIGRLIVTRLRWEL